MIKNLVLTCVTLVGCSTPNGPFEDGEHQAARHKVEAWEGPCTDKSWLLSTTAGSPDVAECPNKHHHMRVQVATTPSHEEIGALVFCECERDEKTDAQSP